MAINRNVQELAENILAMLENNRNQQDIAEVVRAFMHTNEATKKRKREANLKEWKWNDVIDVDSLPDSTEHEIVPKIEDSTPQQHAVAFQNNHVMGLTLPENGMDEDDDIPLAPFKINKRNQVKITGRARLCRLFDEDANDTEEVLGEEASNQDQDSDYGSA